MSDEELFGRVLGNEATCRTLLDQLIARGVQLSVAPENLTHEECAEICIQILSECKRMEKDGGA